GLDPGGLSGSSRGGGADRRRFRSRLLHVRRRDGLVPPYPPRRVEGGISARARRGARGRSQQRADRRSHVRGESEGPGPVPPEAPGLPGGDRGAGTDRRVGAPSLRVARGGGARALPRGARPRGTPSAAPDDVPFGDPLGSSGTPTLG